MSDAVMVPREPTEAMIAAADCAGMAFAGSDLDSADMTRMIWSAMLAASPSVGGWEDVAGTGAFLLDRLADFERTVESESGDAAVNDWHGHVVPAIARFRSALSAPPPPGSRPQEAVPTEGHGAAVVALTRKTASALPVGTALEVIDADSFLRHQGFPNGARVTLRKFDGEFIDIGEIPYPQGTCPFRFAVAPTPQPADGRSSNEGAA